MFQKMKNWLTKKINDRTYKKYSKYFRYHDEGSSFLERRILVLEGKYRGAVFFFHTTEVNWWPEVIVVRPPNNNSKIGDDFYELANFILFCIHYKSNDTNSIGEDYGYRESYSEEPFVQRAVRKKNTSILEE